ncbi:hypothetical protein MP228_007762 [Amoeboaphelidium protococcarum]|nr:hypothetical protein MP228_007762 [Amoeboaphelidium protococcarum]
MKAQCYAAIAVAVSVAMYEYQRVTGLDIVLLLKTRPQILLSLSQQQISIYVVPALIPSIYACKAMAAYFAWLYLLSFVMPGYVCQSPPLRDGRVIKFYCNGLSSLIATVALYVGLSYYGVIKYTLCCDEFSSLLVLAHYIAFAVSLYLFIRGRARNMMSGVGVIEDFVMGQELVPEVLGLKLNFFWLRPSMMLWLFINLSFLAKHYELNNGAVSVPMVLYQVFTNWYVIDYFLFEEFVTSTWDIIAEKFGFMLVWGDLCFIPFTFTLQLWFLTEEKVAVVPFSSVQASLCVITFLTGYVIFRFANWQKHSFKKDPSGLIWGREPEVIGGRLLVSGWWGLASHINYLGDLILAASYALPCGLRFLSFIPYFYPIYLFLLLIHRDWRDDDKCSKKYGKLWKQYRSRVPYRILPGIY